MDVPIFFLIIGETDYAIMSPLMNFVSDNEDQFVPKEMKQFSYNLKLAKKMGEAGKSIELCRGKEGTFKHS